jgi:guanylate kinase
MVKSSSRPRKASKFVIDLGPEIDKVVKKKNVKIRKQKLRIAELEDKLRGRGDDMKIKKQKLVISGLQAKLNQVENELKRYKVQRVNINNKTLEYAFKRLRQGYSLSRMKPSTHLLIQQAGRWDEARLISARFKVC